MYIPVELSKVVIDENAEQQIIALREINGNRELLIAIGIPEVLAIDRSLKQIKTPRPLTHELLLKTIGALGAEIEKVIITTLKSGTYFAELHLLRNEEEVVLDCRPSDAIAICLMSHSPIFISDTIFNPY